MSEQFYLTYKWEPKSYYQSDSGWTWESWQSSRIGSSQSDAVHCHTRDTLWLGALTLCRISVGVFYSPIQFLHLETSFAIGKNHYPLSFRSSNSWMIQLCNDLPLSRHSQNFAYLWHKVAFKGHPDRLAIMITWGKIQQTNKKY